MPSPAAAAAAARPRRRQQQQQRRSSGTAGDGDHLVLTPAKLRLESSTFAAYVSCLWLPNAVFTSLLLLKVGHAGAAALLPWWLVFMPMLLGHAGHIALSGFVLTRATHYVEQQLGPPPPPTASPGMVLHYGTMLRERRAALAIDCASGLLESAAMFAVKAHVCALVAAGAVASADVCWRLLLLPCWLVWAVTFVLSLLKPRRERAVGTLRDLLMLCLLFAALRLDGVVTYAWSVVFLVPWMWFGALFLGALVAGGVIAVAYACMDLRELALPGGFLLLLVAAGAQLPGFVFLAALLDGDGRVRALQVLLPMAASWGAMWAAGLVVAWGLRRKEQLRARLAAAGQVWTAHEAAARELMPLEMEDLQASVDRMTDDELAEVAVRMMQGKAQPQQLLRVGTTLYRRALSFTAAGGGSGGGSGEAGGLKQQQHGGGGDVECGGGGSCSCSCGKAAGAADAAAGPRSPIGGVLRSLDGDGTAPLSAVGGAACSGVAANGCCRRCCSCCCSGGKVAAAAGEEGHVLRTLPLLEGAVSVNVQLRPRSAAAAPATNASSGGSGGGGGSAKKPSPLLRTTASTGSVVDCCVTVLDAAAVADDDAAGNADTTNNGGGSKPPIIVDAAAVAAAAEAAAAAAAAAQDAAAAAAAAAASSSDDDGLCTICFDAPASCVFMECGHGGYCWRCAHVLFARPPGECPVCRARIVQVVELEDPAAARVGAPVRVKQSSGGGSRASGGRRASSSGGGSWLGGLGRSLLPLRGGGGSGGSGGGGGASQV